MKIAFLTLSPKGATDRFLARFAEDALRAGWRVAGVVQINVSDTVSERREMRLKLLPEGMTIRISQDLGPGASGCSLDPSALETAVGETTATLEQGADLLIVNKFGKVEAEGRGFRGLIGEALSRDIPVLVGLNPAQRAAFETFTGGMAEELSADVAVVKAWLEGVALAQPG